MADIDTSISTADGQPHSPPLLVARLHRKDTQLLMQGRWEEPARGWVSDGRYKGTRSPRSSMMGSARSSGATRPSSITDKRRSMDIHPVESVLPAVGQNAGSSVSFDEASQRSLEAPFRHHHHQGGRSEKARTNSGTNPFSLPPPPPPLAAARNSQPQPPSPRSHIHALQKFPNLPSRSYAGPMERYLAQDDLTVFQQDDPEQVEENKTRLRSLRINVIRLRLQLRTKRKELREKESAKIVADEAFMRCVRQTMALPLTPDFNMEPTSSAPLNQYFAAMQQARDDYGPLEYDYNRLEDSLDEAEFELAKIEGRLYRNNPLEVTDSELSMPPIHKTAASSGSDLELSLDGHENYHPLHAEYLSRLGDLDLAIESYHNTKQELEILLQEQETRSRLGIELNEDQRFSLEDLPLRETALQEEITELETEIDQLRSRCLEEGIDIDESSDWTSSADARGAPINGDSGSTKNLNIPDIRRPPSEYSHSMFPLLFPESDDGKAHLKDLITEFDEGNKNDRINRWLLYTLRTSPLEVDLLALVFLQLANILDFRQWCTDLHQWQLHVLSLWEKDGANRSPEAFVPARTASYSSTNQTKKKSKPCSQVNGLLTTSEGSAKNKITPGSIDLGKLISKGSEIVQMLGI
ncbi:hypothetical protein G7Y89_g281 [Cudoniella acicularis]|uniref:Uncharacterized protein n=1 Tax=Cudoniella acicularis TaxID=354080 RepID=A0A8H4RXJ0_9HELO|nr:hypothetical protein G7Y89_g281 [Cudoniella acicularis]